MPRVPLDDVDVVGEISYPACGISLPVAAEWKDSVAKRVPCVYVGSAYGDDMIVAGHSYKSHFRGLYDARVGDEVSFTDMAGNVFRYRVTETTTVDGTDVAGLKSGEWDLTLFTCTRDSRSRVVVRCERSREEAVV